METDPTLRRAISGLIRQRHEHVRAIARGRAVQTEPALLVPEERHLEEVPEESSSRILVIISNLESGREEGGILSVKPTSQTDHEIETALPITENFTINISHNSSVSVERSTASSPLQANFPSQDELNRAITITIESGGQKLSFQTNSVLKEFLDHVRRLKAIARQHQFSQTGSHSWLRWYNPLIAQRKLDLRNPARLLRTPYPPPSLSNAAAGDPGDEETDISVIKEEWIRDQLHQLMSSYAKLHAVSLRICTFNVNGRFPSGNLHSWLGMPKDLPEEEFELPDIYVFGFQELDLSTEALVYAASPVRENAWSDAILQTLGDRADGYVKAASKQLVGMLLIIFVRKVLRVHISSIASSASGQGALWMGNKGGVAVRLQVYDTVLTFVNSHLAAGDSMVERRNADYNELHRSLTFPPVGSGNDASAYATIFDSDHTFWLNYRVDLPDLDVRELIAMGSRSMEDYTELMPFDQLLYQRRVGKCFTEFTEAQITFAPTYRFVVGDEDGINHDIKRRPAWTDRVLSRTLHPKHLTQLNYESHPEVSLSDHKPVSSRFSIEVLELDLGSLSHTLEHLYTKVGSKFSQEENPPDVRVQPVQVDVGKVRYRTPQAHSFELVNYGQVACTFRFVPPASEQPLSKPWLAINPVTGVLLPGQRRSITLDVFVDDKSANLLNQGKATLEDVLVLHISHGKDHFIPISGTFLRTCFANNLEWLASLPGPIRKVQDTTASLERHNVSAPRDIIRLVNWLMGNALDQESLFFSDAELDHIHAVRECLDTGDDFPKEIDSLAVGQTFLELLRSFERPVIPWELHAQCSVSMDRNQAYEVLELLPQAAANVFVSTTAFLHFLCSSQDNQKRAHALARVFAPILLKDDPSGGPSTWISPVAKRRFILHFLL